MNKMLIQLQKENEKTIKKYMNQTDIKFYNPLFNMKSIIKKNLESNLPFPLEDEKIHNNKKEKSPSYHPGGIKKNRVKCYKEMNHELLKEEERKKKRELEEEKKRKKKINQKELQRFFKRNEQELLENILKLNEKLLTPINEDEDVNYELIKEEELKNKAKNNNLPINIKQLYIFGTNFTCEQNPNNNFFVYHKKDRWICYPNSDCVIIDKYVDDISSAIDLHKKQIILAKHKNKSYINSLKLSSNGEVIYFKNEDKYLIFYKYDYQKKKFEYISEMKINYNKLINEFIMDQNEIFCIALYDDCYIKVLDFASKNEIIDEKID